MTILLDRSKGEVCKNIYEEVVKVTTKNQAYRTQIIRKLLQVCKDVVCQNLSFAAICTAAENGKSTAPILSSLLKADEKKVLKLILEVYSQAEESEGWPREIVPKLEARLNEIPYRIGYPITSGMPLLRYQARFTLEQRLAQLGS